MEKLWIIVRREYITRIRKRSFIIGTLLAPLGILVYLLVMVGLSKYNGTEEIRIAVLDKSEMAKNLPDENGVRYIKSGTKTLENLKDEVAEGTYDGVLSIPELSSIKSNRHTIFYYSDKKLTPEQESRISKRVERKIKEYKLKTLNLESETLDLLDTDVSIDPEKLDGTKDDSSKITTGFAVMMGLFMAFIMFFMVMMYGQMVMRSVMEEKVNRIVEVMMSSVRPFQLMLGKIIGAGLTGFTQVVCWIVLGGGVYMLVLTFFAGDLMGMEQNMPISAQGGAQVDPEEVENMVTQVFNEAQNQNWWMLLSFFVIYFLGGYFIYASLFAAIGSTISDDMGEAQSLTLPITIPIIFAFYLIAFAGVRNPHSGLMVFSSIFPLFSPIVMPFRLAFDPPWWQVGLSVACLILGTLLFVWLAGRIYRIGILLYGKKVTFKELGKWLFYP